MDDQLKHIGRSLAKIKERLNDTENQVKEINKELNRSLVLFTSVVAIIFIIITLYILY